MKVTIACLLIALAVSFESTGQIRRVSRMPCLKCHKATKKAEKAHSKLQQSQFVKVDDNANATAGKHHRKVS